MKKMYLLIFLLFSMFGFAQVNLTGKANYHAIVTVNVTDATGDGCNKGGLGYLYLDGIGALSVLKKDDDTFWEARTDIFERDFTESNLATSISIYTRRRARSGGCKITQEKKITVEVGRNQDITYKDWGDNNIPGIFAYNVSGTLRVQTYPIINLTNPDTNNNIIGTMSSINIPEIQGILPQYFEWMYHIEGEGYYRNRPLGGKVWVNTWRSFPNQYQGKNSLNIKCQDFLPVEAVGKKITLRANAYGSTVDLLYAKSAPHIDSVNSVITKCTDSNDGRVIVKFDSNLIVGETLTCSILSYDTVTGKEQDVFYSTPNGESIVISDNLTYEIPYDFFKGNYRIKLLGWFKEPNKVGANTYVMDSNHQYDFSITAPSPLDFTLGSSNLNCYGSQDGTITITPIGGTRDKLGSDYYSLDNGNNWVPFPNNAPYTIAGLAPGTYKVKVKDMNGCIAKVQTLVNGEIQLGEDKVIETTITQPPSPLTVEYIYKQNPTFFGGHNGKIIALVSGGTIKEDQSYNYKWIKSTGEELPAKGQYNSKDKNYTITLENIPSGEYKLTLTDKNYSIAANKTNCSIVESSQFLTQPHPIVITLSEVKSISCNTENTDSDPNKFSDGSLNASVIGGTPPYEYVWSKFNKVANTWEKLTEEKSNTLQNLNAGNYSLNVVDANGIVQGTYNIAGLVSEIPTVKELTEPIKLHLSFDSKNVSCYEGSNGWAKANVTGGMAPYTYTWYNVNSGLVNHNEISQVTAGKYFVEVRDNKGCFTKGSVLITEPQSAVAIEYIDVLSPTFSGATNGRITAKISGGTPYDDQSYQYEWKNSKGQVQNASSEVKDGFYTLTIEGVPADDYFLTIKDKKYNEGTNEIVNCSVLESKVILNEPKPLEIVFEIIRKISCNAANEFGDNTDLNPKDGQRDESQDGILTAHVTGGTILPASANGGLPYYFYWKKQQADGSWKMLQEISGSTAINLSHGNYALNVKDRNGIMLGTYVNNVLTQETDVMQLMQEPPKLSVTTTKGDVFCYNGNDGWAMANVIGGTPPYVYNWSNGVEMDKNTVLKAGEYWVFITDANGCTAQESVIIVQPVEPLEVKYTEILNPSFYKATNGKIVAEVRGGTILSSNSYWFEWKNSKGVLQNAQSNFDNGVFTISLDGIPEETYTLNIQDANYDNAANKSNCKVSNSAVTLEHPDPLEVNFEIIRGISCNVGNEFGNETDTNPQDNQRDESQDGILATHVKGGVQLQADQNNGLSYYYTWKKKESDGSWKLLNNETDTIEHLSEGTYALNIEDANGIKLGTYVNNRLTKETDATQYMSQPEKLSLSFTKLNASCNNGDDGWAEVHVSGGTPPYTYEWTNGETIAKIENITTGNYFVQITDVKGCITQGSVFVGDPKGILTTEEIKNPTCYKGNDGSILLHVTGGNLPYTYQWNTGATTKDLQNVEAGNYEVAITCPDCCVYRKRFTLKNPDPIVVSLGNDRTLCKDQILEVDASIADKNAQYNWTSTNGFASNQPKVSLTKAGTYRVKVTSSLGCIGEDEIEIKTSKELINSEFLLSSQAYLDEEVILVNTSDPYGESTEWIVPNEVKIVEQKDKYITLQFDKIGTYTISLMQTQGECYALYNKDVLVEKRNTLPNKENAVKSIIDFIVTPNPSNGNFKAIINLENSSPVNLRLFSISGQYSIQKKDSGKKNYEFDFNTSLQAGMYILVLETEYQTLVKKIIIN